MRRDQIVRATITVLATSGFAHTSLARIAQQLGISKGVISYHFAGKEDLLRQVVTTIYTVGAVEMAAALQAATTPREQLHAYIRSNLAFIASHPAEIRALGEIFLNLRRPSGEPFYGPADEEPIIAVLEQGFRAGQATGQFRQFDTRVMALSLRAAIDKFSAQVGGGGTIAVEIYTEELITLFDSATHHPEETDPDKQETH